MPYTYTTSPKALQQAMPTETEATEQSSASSSTDDSNKNLIAAGLFTAAKDTSKIKQRPLLKLPDEGGVEAVPVQKEQKGLVSGAVNKIPVNTVASCRFEEMGGKGNANQVSVLNYLKFNRRKGDKNARNIIYSINKEVKKIESKVNEQPANESKVVVIEIWDEQDLKRFRLNNVELKEIALWLKKNEEFKELARRHWINDKIETFLEDIMSPIVKPFKPVL